MAQKQDENGDASQQDQLNREYYEEYSKIFVANAILLEKLKEIVDQKEEQVTKLKKVQVSSALMQLSANQILSSLSNKNLHRQKRVRRRANEIQRSFTCPLPKCKKSYGTEGSLHQHLKQKHKKYFAKYCLQHKIMMPSGEAPVDAPEPAGKGFTKP